MLETATVVTLLLALAGYFFDFVKKDAQGNKMRTSFGLPILSSYGVFAVVLAVTSNGLAYWKTTTDAASAKMQNKELSDKYDELQRQYKDLQKQNDALSGKVDDKFKAQLKTQETEANGILKDLHAETAQTIQQISVAAAQLRNRTLNAFESNRRAQSPVNTVIISWDWPHGAKAWDSLSSLCRLRKPDSEVISVSMPPNRPVVCRYESGGDRYVFLDLSPEDSQSMAKKIEGVRIYSPPFPGMLDFKNRANTSIFVDDHGISMTKYEPEIFVSWFDTVGIEITIDRADIRPPVIDVNIEQEGFATIRHHIVTIWADPQKANEYTSGPHLILRKP